MKSEGVNVQCQKCGTIFQVDERNDYFEYAIKRCEENAGFICDDMEELKVCLKGIIRIEDREYQMLSQGALNALNSFSPEVVGRQLKGILEGR